MGKARKCRARENRGGRDKKEKEGREMITVSAASPSPQFPPVFFRVRAFSIPWARPSRSLEQATQSGAKATKFFGAVVIFI